ncbi:MAG: hypothetical protein MJK04_27500, partial [Psychrosphaera sp.]|nr:hypothetical protein [Psychrosphaera sp.]
MTHLFERPEEYDYLTTAYQTILQSINKAVEHSYYGYGKDNYSLTGYSALRACINHPHIFMSNNITQPFDKRCLFDGMTICLSLVTIWKNVSNILQFRVIPG